MFISKIAFGCISSKKVRQNNINLTQYFVHFHYHKVMQFPNEFVVHVGIGTGNIIIENEAL